MSTATIKCWKLFLDDERFPAKNEENAIICRSSKEAIELCLEMKSFPNEIMFDHDLGGDDTSIRFIRWMIDMLLDDQSGNFKLPIDFKYSIHSQNPIGAANIKSYMDGIIKEFK
jgi:hypothetical protein